VAFSRHLRYALFMALLEILKFPDPRLRKKCKPVSEVTEELQVFAQDMLETMYHSRGIGLAAAQVDRQVRFLVTDTRPREGGRYKPEDQTELEALVPQPLFLFNPVITKKRGRTTFDEGCLSVPTYFETVERADYIELEALGLDGKKFQLKTDGLLAICIQHEIDHLDGKLFIDRLSPIKSARIKSKIKKFGYPDPGSTHDDEETHDSSAKEEVL
jgi:peptide deformylase